MPQLLLTFVLIGIGWFVIVRPQQARLRAQKAMVAELVAGDRVITAGGIHGTLTEVGADTVRIEVAPGIELTLARPAITRKRDDEGDGAEGANPIDSSDLDADDGIDDSLPGPTGDHAEDNVTQHPDGPSTGGVA